MPRTTWMYPHNMNSPKNPLPPIKIFISYVRNDDENFNFVDPITKRLRQMITGLTSRPVEIFVDRQDINLGDNWRETIEQAVRCSYFFVPIYTGSYPLSAACREEFALFRDTASRIDVTGLIIPVLLLGMDSLREEGEDDISDYIRNHQSVDFQQAWENGTESPEYRTAIGAIARQVRDRAPEIDAALALAEEIGAGKQPENVIQQSIALLEVPDEILDEQTRLDDDIAEEIGILELSTEITEQISVIEKSAEAMGQALFGLGEIEAPPETESATQADMSKYMIRVASRLKEPAKDIEKNGVKLLAATSESDQLLLQLVKLVRYSGSPEMMDSMTKGLYAGVSSLEETREVAEQLEELLDSMRVPEALSASIRRSLKPARRGITAVQDAIRIMTDWPQVFKTASLE